MKNDNDIRDLKDAIEDERRKSMVDEGKIKELEGVLAQKIKDANLKNHRLEELERKSEQDDQEIRYLRD